MTAQQLAADSSVVAQAGAGCVHVHVKDAAGRDTLDGVALAETLRAIRAAVPGLPVGVTTGAWAVPDPRSRPRLLAGWTELPDFASVNWHEDGAEDLAFLLLARGVGVEAGLWQHESVAAWAQSDVRHRCLRAMVELQPDAANDADGAVEQAESLVRQAAAATGDIIPVLVHGEGPNTWPVLEYARRAGLPTRIGLEDTVHLPDGTAATGNEQLVRMALAL